MATIEQFVQETEVRFVRDFYLPLLRIPSISRLPLHYNGCVRTAEFIAKALGDCGFEVGLHEIGQGHPAILARRMVSDKFPTVTSYGHYDVLPAEDIWDVGGITVKPFEPRIIEGIVYGRGAADMKGQLASWIWGLQHFKEQGFPDVNLALTYEGDEEGGKTEYPDFIRAHADELRSDVTIISDCNTIQLGYPAVFRSLKGIYIGDITNISPWELIEILAASQDPVFNTVRIPGFYSNVEEVHIQSEVLKLLGGNDPNMGSKVVPEFGFEAWTHRWHRPTNSPLYVNYANFTPAPASDDQLVLRITANGPKIVLHSGDYGGPAPEPALMLAQLLSDLKHGGMEFEIDYITYGSTPAETKIRPTAEAQIVIFEDDMERLLSVVEAAGNSSYGVLEVEDEREEYLGERRLDLGSAAISMSFRLVPNQTPDEIGRKVEAAVKAIAPNAVYTHGSSGMPFGTDLENPYCKAAIEGLKQGYGTRDVHKAGTGGSIPIAHTLKEALGGSVVLAGFATPDCRMHGPCENHHIKEGLVYGARSVAHMLENIARVHSN